MPSWGAKMAFGDRVVVGGHEVVVTALVIFGLGGGSGTWPEHGTVPEGQGEGSGGGGRLGGRADHHRDEVGSSHELIAPAAPDATPRPTAPQENP